MYTLIHYRYCNLVYKIGSIYWSPFFLLTSRLLRFSSPTSLSRSTLLTSSLPALASSRCAKKTSTPFTTMSSSRALPPSASSRSNTRTLSLPMTSSPATWFLYATQNRTCTLDARPSRAMSDPWSSLEGPPTAHTALQNWMGLSQSSATLPFVLSHISRAHEPPSQSHAFWHTKTLLQWSKTPRTISTTPSKATTRLDRGRSRFQPPGRCKVATVVDRETARKRGYR